MPGKPKPGDGDLLEWRFLPALAAVEHEHRVDLLQAELFDPYRRILEQQTRAVREPSRLPGELGLESDLARRFFHNVTKRRKPSSNRIRIGF